MAKDEGSFFPPRGSENDDELDEDGAEEEGAEKEEGTGEGESNSDKAATINPGWFHVRQRELAFPRLESPMKGGRLSGEAVEYETGIVAGSVGLRTTCGAGRGC